MNKTILELSQAKEILKLRTINEMSKLHIEKTVKQDKILNELIESLDDLVEEQDKRMTSLDNERLDWRSIARGTRADLARVERQLKNLQDKVEHGCTDATCPTCDPDAYFANHADPKAREKFEKIG